MTEPTPTEVAIKKRRRITFGVYLGLVFLVATLAAWWILPTFASHAKQISDAGPTAAAPTIVVAFMKFATIFKILWVPIAIGGVVLGICGARGLLDPFLPLLNVLLVLLGAGLIVVCFLGVFMPMFAMTGMLR
jgi:hypothetical protein